MNSKIWIPASLLLSLAFIVASGCSRPPEDTTLPFQGTWKVSETAAGNKKSEKEAAFDKDDFMIVDVAASKTGTSIKSGGPGRGRGKFRVDNTKNPKEFEYVSMEGDDQGKTIEGIYKMEGPTLTICVATSYTDPRPTDFAAGPKSVLWVMEKK